LKKIGLERKTNEPDMPAEITLDQEVKIETAMEA